MRRNVFILGLDESRLAELTVLPDPAQYTFHQLKSGAIDAITGYWDFPVTVMVPILCHRYEPPTKSLEAVVKWEHKYWSQLEQQRVIDEYPGFDMIDVQDTSATPSWTHSKERSGWPRKPGT